ncbi:hypothetical protein HK103_006203 [Boothiomyces macroporosus]|uniref:Elongator complex protein 5 n=1 Tax=Boothiomyces macroporosus TaxID=261099 RepID=A0AAD5UDW9_9FUNG|nr:hypothetical protein HK103_006203 [Boothiomyces macroporosus]
MVLGSLVDSSTLLIKTEGFPFQLQTIEMDIAVIRERKPKTILVDSINNILYFHGIDFLADLFSLDSMVQLKISLSKQITVSLRKKTRTIVETDDYTFDGEIKLVPKETEKKKEKKVDVEGIASFNLSLTDKEREKKDGLVMPYIEAQQGVINYYHEQEDDFDSEDPDEDLDI